MPEVELMQRREDDAQEEVVDVRGEAHLLLGLEVVEEDAALLGFLTPVLDDNARAVDNLTGVAFTVDLAYPLISPHVHIKP